TPFIGAEFIPAADQGQLEISAETREGSKLEETERVVDEVNEVMEEYKDIIDVSFVTVGADSFGFGGSGNSANYTIQLVPVSERSLSTTELVIELDETLSKIAGAEIGVSEMDAGMAAMGSDPIQIQLNGPEHDVLRELSNEVVREIEQIDGVFNATSGASEGVAQLHEIGRAHV